MRGSDVRGDFKLTRYLDVARAEGSPRGTKQELRKRSSNKRDQQNSADRRRVYRGRETTTTLDKGVSHENTSERMKRVKY